MRVTHESIIPVIASEKVGLVGVLVKTAGALLDVTHSTAKHGIPVFDVEISTLGENQAVEPSVKLAGVGAWIVVPYSEVENVVSTIEMLPCGDTVPMDKSYSTPGSRTPRTGKTSVDFGSCALIFMFSASCSISMM